MQWKRIIVVGDIHGCLEEFDELLRQVEFKRSEDRLVLLGDLVDRGPDSVGTVARAMELKAECLRGNHEWKHQKIRKHLLLEKAGKEPPPRHPMSREIAAIQSGLSEAQWAWIDTLPYSIRLTPTLVLAHAGLEPAVPFEKQDPESLMRVRNVTVHGTFNHGPWYEKPVGGYYWSEGWKGPESVIYGHQVHNLHTPRLDIDKNSAAWCLGIDTGCCYGGKLTAVVFHDEDKHWKPTLATVQGKHAYSTWFSNKDDAKRFRKDQKKKRKNQNQR